jgi:hypothetical protein
MCRPGSALPARSAWPRAVTGSIGGDETGWQRFANLNILLDNLLTEGNFAPTIVVMPNGRAQKNDQAEGTIFSSAPTFAAFEQELPKDVIG